MDSLESEPDSLKIKDISDTINYNTRMKLNMTMNDAKSHLNSRDYKSAIDLLEQHYTLLESRHKLILADSYLKLIMDDVYHCGSNGNGNNHHEKSRMKSILEELAQNPEYEKEISHIKTSFREWCPQG